MSLGRVRAQLDGALELRFRSRPVPVKVLSNQSERNMSFGKAVIDFDALHGRRLRTLPHLLGRYIPRSSHEGISVRQSGIGLRVGGILFDGLTKEIDCLLKSILRPLVPIEKTLEI